MLNIYHTIIIFLSSTIILLFAKKMSKNLGLIDVARQHKRHIGSVPLVGGISIFSGILAGKFLLLQNSNELDYFFVAMSVVFLTGLLDDRFDLKVITRFILQILAVTIMAFEPSSVLTSLGNIFNSSVDLKMLSLPMTIIAVVGIINALNMIDGIDGLAASLSLVTLGSIVVLSFGALKNQSILLIPSILFISILPYLLFNLTLFGRSNKVFLGDSGSMLVGFIIAWLLISLSQGDESKRLFAPVTALWMFAIPLVDTISIMIRRIIKKQSPFLPDRTHLHHIIMRLGYSDNHALIFIVLLSIGLTSMGMWMELNDVAESTSFKLFLLFSAGYLLILIYIWKILKFVRKFLSK